MDMKKIEELAKTPRTDLKDVATFYTKPMLGFLRKKAVADWEVSAANAPLIFLAVVQANSDLYERNENTFAPGVLIFTTDKNKIRDAKWLIQTAKKVAEVRDMDNVPEEYKHVYDVLNDTESLFDTFQLPTSLTDGIPTFMEVTSFDRIENVEGGRLHDESILVGLDVNDCGYEHYTPIADVKLYK